MKFIIKVSKNTLRCCLILILAAIPITSSAQDVVPAYIVVKPTTLHADCHTWTGCGVIVADVYHCYKPKRHRACYRSCDACGEDP